MGYGAAGFGFVGVFTENTHKTKQKQPQVPPELFAALIQKQRPEQPPRRSGDVTREGPCRHGWRVPRAAAAIPPRQHRHLRCHQVLDFRRGGKLML